MTMVPENWIETDEQALEELLDGLAFDPNEEDLLSSSDADTQKRELLGKAPSAFPATQEDNGDEDEDSDGEHMTKEVEKLLSRVRDELTLSDQRPERVSEEDEKGGTCRSGTGGDSAGAHISTDKRRKNTTAEKASSDETNESTQPKGASIKDDVEDEEEGGLSLPAVPSSPPKLPSPPPEDEGGDNNQERRKSVDFENDIAARLATLRGGGSGAVINFDSFGLPSAPTFRPEERTSPAGGSSSTPSSAFRTNKGKAGYTDEDQKTWCIVCLDDASIRCIGCENDVYCARCWREMHTGPRAGYDERGHQWVKFVKGG